MHHLHADHARYDKQQARQGKLSWAVVVLSAFAVLMSGVLMFLGLPRILSNDTQTKALAKNSETQACRSEYTARVTAASSDVLTLILNGLAATASGDEDALTELVTGPQGESPAERLSAVLDQRNHELQQAARLSRTDPDAFLLQCHRVNP